MKTSSDPKADVKVFQSRLKAHKAAIDQDIAKFTKQTEMSTLQNYGAHSRIATDAYLSILNRGGKRIRGALCMVGYEMSGGKNGAMIIQAARAIEMIHAYILIVDDFQDRSSSRRGGPSAHVLLSDYYKRHSLGNDAEHFGESIAMNAALTGNHAAQMVLSNLDAREQLKLNAISILNRSMIITAHGQTNDIFNEAAVEVSERDVDQVLEWKTAHYTFLNPLHVGMILAGADCHATDAITEYAMHAGRAFQITDDIMGTFGEEFSSGKSPMDDIREGKRTLLSVYGLKRAPSGDKNFLIQMLGNREITQTEFQRCRDILVETGALDYARTQAQKHVATSIESLNKHAKLWDASGAQFLRGLAEYLLGRTS